jgi:hypothetical protein
MAMAMGMAMTEQAVSTEQTALRETRLAKRCWGARRQGEPASARRPACATLQRA